MTAPACAPAFLDQCGWGGARIEPLAGDASFRRYFRVIDGDRRAVLMDAPPPHEDPRPFIAVAQWLAQQGLAVPDVLASDLDHGLLLIRDLGDRRLRETLDGDPALEPALYAGITDLLVHLHRCAPMPGLADHGLANWLSELDLFTDWYCPALDLAVDRAGWTAAWRQVLEPVADDALARVTMLRDYHAENIMLLPSAPALDGLGLLDFQDAMHGHPAYDLASVLQDARRDVTPAVETAMLDRYAAATGADARFTAAYWALAAQRNTRILGVFTRLWRRDNKPHYRQFQPRMWGLLERDLAWPALAPVRAWFDANVPQAARAAAWRDGL